MMFSLFLYDVLAIVLSDDTYPLFYDVSLKNFCLMMFFYRSMTFLDVANFVWCVYRSI